MLHKYKLQLQTLLTYLANIKHLSDNFNIIKLYNLRKIIETQLFLLCPASDLQIRRSTSLLCLKFSPFAPVEPPDPPNLSIS